MRFNMKPLLLLLLICGGVMAAVDDSEYFSSPYAPHNWKPDTNLVPGLWDIPVDSIQVGVNKSTPVIRSYEPKQIFRMDVKFDTSLIVYDSIHPIHLDFAHPGDVFIVDSNGVLRRKP